MSRDRACSLLSLIAAADALAPIAAQAGDFADRALLGFSPDGRYFALEEYGIQDGSGYPYSNIFLIDTTTDEWVTGTPIEGNHARDEPVTICYTAHKTISQVVV